MEDNKKKIIMISTAVGCLVLAGAVMYASRSKERGIKSIGSNETIWVKCSAPDCGQAYQIRKKAYFEFVQKETKPMAAIPPMVCEKCGQKSVYRAVKCERCANVFFYGEVVGGFPDRCPECSFSKIENLRKKVRK